MIRFIVLLLLSTMALAADNNLGPLFPTLDLDGTGTAGAPLTSWGSTSRAGRQACMLGNSSGNEIAYNAGASDATTPRVAANLKLEGNSPDVNYGSVGSSTIRIASQPGNSTGAANFGYGDAGAQTQRVISVPVDGTKATYRAASAAVFSSATTATDICTLTGSATKTVRLTKLRVTGVQTTQSEINLFYLKRSTANSGGTSTTLTAVPADSNDAAATATARTYTANPTTGTLVGNIDSFKFVIPVAAVGANTPQGAPPEEVFGNGPERAIVLRGTGEVFAVNLGSTTVTGGSFLCRFEWTEE